MAKQDYEVRQPLLNYTILDEDLGDKFQQEIKISAVAIGEKVLICGTNNGTISIFDLSGFKTQDLIGHACQVEDLSLDNQEEYVASCSADGTVRIQNFFTGEQSRFKFKHKLKSVAINPRYGLGAKDFITGDLEGQLIQHSKGYLSSSEVLVKDKGAIQKIIRQGYLIAYVDDHAVQVYDSALRIPLASLKHPTNYSQQLLHKQFCNMYWVGEFFLVVGWLNRIQICQIDSNLNPFGGWEGPSLQQSARSFEVLTEINLQDQIIMGLQPYGQDIGILFQEGLVAKHILHHEVNKKQPNDRVAVNVNEQSRADKLEIKEEKKEDGEGSKQKSIPEQGSSKEEEQMAGGGEGTAGGGDQEEQGERQRADGTDAGALSQGNGSEQEGAGNGSEESSKKGDAQSSENIQQQQSQQLQKQQQQQQPQQQQQKKQQHGEIEQNQSQEQEDIQGMAQQGSYELVNENQTNAENNNNLMQLKFQVVDWWGEVLSTDTIHTYQAYNDQSNQPISSQQSADQGQSSSDQQKVEVQISQNDDTQNKANLKITDAVQQNYNQDIDQIVKEVIDDLNNNRFGLTAILDRDQIYQLYDTAFNEFKKNIHSPRTYQNMLWWESGQEPNYWIIASQAIYSAVPLTGSEKIRYFISQEQFNKAILIMKNDTHITEEDRSTLIQEYFSHLLNTNQSQKVAKLSVEFLGTNTKWWTYWIDVFQQKGIVNQIASYIPAQKLRLDPNIYKEILITLVEDDQSYGILKDILKKWPPDYIPTQLLIQEVTKQLIYRDNTILQELLAQLYELSGRQDLVLDIYLRIRSQESLHYLQRNQHILGSLSKGWSYQSQKGLPQINLKKIQAQRSINFGYLSPKEKISTLLELSQVEGCHFLGQHYDVIVPALILQVITDKIQQSKNQKSQDIDWRFLLHHYLMAMFDANPNVGAEYHDLQVELYADYEPSKLMSFLRQSTYYDMDKAREICEKKQLVSERLYLLGKLGMAQQAIKVIVEDLQDIPRAVEFIIDLGGSTELWNCLVITSTKDPNTTGNLLDKVAGYIDPLIVIKQIPYDMQVPRLRDRIIKIIANYRTNAFLKEGFHNIIVHNCLRLMEIVYKNRQKAIPNLYMVVQEQNGRGQNGHTGGQGKGGGDDQGVYQVMQVLENELQISAFDVEAMFEKQAHTSDPEQRDKLLRLYFKKLQNEPWIGLPKNIM